jgi:hypothetical protein
MTKKDYNLIVKALHGASLSVCSHSTSRAEIIAFQDGKNRALQQFVHVFTAVAKRDNPNFSAERFYAAFDQD